MQQVYCQECNLYFREGNNCIHDTIAAKKALYVLLYSMARGLFCIWHAVTTTELFETLQRKLKGTSRSSRSKNELPTVLKTLQSPE